MKLRPWIVVLLVVLAAATVRLRLLEMPLERDEGEYAYVGQLMLQGVPPYQLASNMKLPGTYSAYALILAAFGQTTAAIHLGLLLVNAGSIVLVFLLGRRLFGAAAGVAACAAYALLSVGEGCLGTQAHATHFVILPALGGALLLLHHAGSGRTGTIWWSGLLFGLAFVMKQPGILFALFGALYLIASQWRTGKALPRKLAVFLCGAAAPFAMTCLLLWRAGVFASFWFWTFTYAREYASELSIFQGIASFCIAIARIVPPNAGIWILAAFGLWLIWRKKPAGSAAIFATLFLVFSLLAVCPGMHFRGHYFVLMFPAVALLAGAAVRNRLACFAFCAALVLALFVQRQFLFRMTPLQASQQIYGTNPFSASIRVAEYIRTHSDANSRIVVLGSEPEIPFYAGRRSATQHLYMYGLMEAQPYALTMQNEMIREVEAAAPQFVVRVFVQRSWLQVPQSPTRIFDWWSTYGAGHYRRVGIADILSESRTEYRWDAAAELYQPRSDQYLAVYRRADDR